MTTTSSKNWESRPTSPARAEARRRQNTAPVRIGLSGWTYPPWRGHFYPKGLPQKDELSFAARAFPALEINGTFYGLQNAGAFGRWREQTPEDFIFAIKGPRFLTHILRLQRIKKPLANFFASGVLRLGPKMGPLLWQFPPSLQFDADKMEEFLALLPHTGEEASHLAHSHDSHLRSDPWFDADGVGTIRHAVEIRHDSFRIPAFAEMLARHQVALVCADQVAWPRLMDLTADFVYCRLHGSEELYRSGYRSEALKAWAARIEAWRQGLPMTDGEFLRGPDMDPSPRTVFFFFDNTDKLMAPRDAESLLRLLADGEEG